MNQIPMFGYTLIIFFSLFPVITNGDRIPCVTNGDCPVMRLPLYMRCITYSCELFFDGPNLCAVERI
ncbi:putative Late nodulin [Medicago truncatula]|uniref:Nodule-specific cysteine-rich peptide 76 n=1 Tax=Medicago truncatula TaxID=3880 RepID=A7KH80_MEDTR|nr:nodule-specific cysteine-rich peptide 76 [Medicago truncatula]AFK42239.1 unknown [Medicago truncatula]RHN60811.1 putative Late nodulin [Medicago truncatula]